MAPCVAKTWQENHPGPSTTNARQHVCAGQPGNANDDHQLPLSVPRFPRYYQQMLIAFAKRHGNDQARHFGARLVQWGELQEADVTEAPAEVQGHQEN